MVIVISRFYTLSWAAPVVGEVKGVSVGSCLFGARAVSEDDGCAAVLFRASDTHRSAHASRPTPLVAICRYIPVSRTGHAVLLSHRTHAYVHTSNKPASRIHELGINALGQRRLPGYVRSVSDRSRMRFVSSP